MKKIFNVVLMAFFSVHMNAQYVDLGLPSGTLWKSSNEVGFYDHFDARLKFRDMLPLESDFNELLKFCTWTWTGNGYHILGSNGNSIFLPAEGHYKNIEGVFSSSVELVHIGTHGSYWGRDMHSNNNSKGEWDTAVTLSFTKENRNIFFYSEDSKRSVRLIKR